MLLQIIYDENMQQTEMLGAYNSVRHRVVALSEENGRRFNPKSEGLLAASDAVRCTRLAMEAAVAAAGITYADGLLRHESSLGSDEEEEAEVYLEARKWVVGSEASESESGGGGFGCGCGCGSGAMASLEVWLQWLSVDARTWCWVSGGLCACGGRGGLGGLGGEVDPVDRFFGDTSRSRPETKKQDGCH